ncbi:MAG: N-formylglutamate amidohydrolase, partial [Magnetovibrio sp.]|nr:N-formylglutamate amidohydrolase [Magnetovibrio sp.]
MDAGRNEDGAAEAQAAAAPPIDIFRPAQQTAPVVFASPHSGRDYAPAFVEQSCLDATALRRSEDAFVDTLFRRAP